ncbi:MAG: DUF4364 family protein [Oscillospiraceae bacterium]|nr:DUF4364 family protein [Oscillospiraceae bacterium]
MAHVGFIRDKLDIKFLILYVAARVESPLPFHDMQALCMCDEGVDYFAFSECMKDLVETEHLSLSADSLYTITDKGRKNSAICESSLPPSVCLRADEGIESINRRLHREKCVRSDVSPREGGGSTVHLALFDDALAPLFDLSLMVPREGSAKDLAKRFEKDPQAVYDAVLGVLFPE